MAKPQVREAQPRPELASRHPDKEEVSSCSLAKESWLGSAPGMARSVSGGAPPPSRAPEDPFRTAPQKGSSGPALERRSLCTPSGQKPRARPQPARTGRGPSPATCRRMGLLVRSVTFAYLPVVSTCWHIWHLDHRAISVPLRPVTNGTLRALTDSPLTRSTP
jgi:hypothetical protein